MATMTVRLGGIVIGKEVIATSNLTPAQNAIGPKKLYVSIRVDNDTKNPMRNPDCIAIELPTDGDLSEITQDEVATAAKWIKDQIKLLHVDYRKIVKATWSQGCEGNLGFYLKHGLLKLKQVPQCVYTDIQDWLNTTYPKAKPASGSAPTATTTAAPAAATTANATAGNTGNAGNTSNTGNTGTPAGNTGNTGTSVNNRNSGCNNNGNGGTPANTGNTGNANNGAPTGNTGAPARNAPAGNTTTPASANTATQPTQAEIDAANGAALFRKYFAQMSAASQQHN
jgi:hypothetical protein